MMRIMCIMLTSIFLYPLNFPRQAYVNRYRKCADTDFRTTQGCAMHDNRISCLILLLVLFPGLGFAAPKFMVVGLFKDKAILDINGKQRLLAAGHQAPEGITLISANSKEAVIEVEGKRGTYARQSHRQSIRRRNGRRHGANFA